VQNSWGGQQFELAGEGASTLEVRGWMTEAASRDLLRFAGQDFDTLVAGARSKDFRPVPLDVTTSLEFTNTVGRASTANVYGVLEGSDPQLKNQYVVYSAHYDHLGVGEPDAKGD